MKNITIRILLILLTLLSAWGLLELNTFFSTKLKNESLLLIYLGILIFIPFAWLLYDQWETRTSTLPPNFNHPQAGKISSSSIIVQAFLKITVFTFSFVIVCNRLLELLKSRLNILPAMTIWTCIILATWLIYERWKKRKRNMSQNSELSKEDASHSTLKKFQRRCLLLIMVLFYIIAADKLDKFLMSQFGIEFTMIFFFCILAGYLLIYRKRPI